MLPVEVFFRNKDEPKKVRFEYDLLLPNLNDPPINQIRSECLTFQNPSEEFRQKLLKAGGVSSGGPPVAPDKGGMQKKRQAASADSEPPKKKKKMDSGKSKSKKKKGGMSSSESSESDSSSDSESGDEAPMTKKGGGGGGGGKKSTPNSWDTGALKRLHRQLNDLQDPQQLQEIVNIIEQTGLFNLTSTTFDFDLCKLDDTTLNKLVKFVEPEKV
jgi:YEATS domain-containing protein 1/3